MRLKTGISTLFICLLAAAVSGQLTLPSNVVHLDDINHWCSKQQAYTTVGEEERYTAKCWTEPAGSRGKFFSFQAEGSDVEIILKRGGEFGSLQEPRLMLLDANLKEIACENYPVYVDYLTLAYNDLRAGHKYYIFAGHPASSKYAGTFSLCVSSKIDYDFKQGAINLTQLSQWCSEDAAYTTANATTDLPSSSCNNRQANFNRWFKFKATTKEIKFEVKPKAGSAKFDFPVITLFDDKDKELACEKYSAEKYSDNSQNFQLDYSQLKVGNWYWVSVDHPRNSKYPGPFDVCVDDGAKYQSVKSLGYTQEDAVDVIGKLTHPSGLPVINSKVQLKDKNGKVLAEATTNELGKFRFTGLPPDQEVMVDLSSEDPDLIVDLLKTGDGDKLVAKMEYDRQKQQANFKALPVVPNNITLVNEQDIDRLLTAGKSGIVGRIVDRFDPVDGMQGVDVLLYENPTAMPVKTTTDADGKFKFEDLNTDLPYLVKLGSDVNKVRAEMILVDEGHQPLQTSSSNEVDLNGFFHFEYLPKIEMEKLGLMDVEDVAIDFDAINAGKPIPLPNIRFNYGSAALLEESHGQLKLLSESLKANANKRIIINGHTDNLGSSDVNVRLSRSRAEAVRNYLVSKGIDQNRMQFEGFGGSQPIADNSTNEGRSKNRRVEVQLLE